MWGNYEDDEMNFEWPTQDDWASMSPDTKLESIEFNTAGTWGLGLVKVNLSNG